MTNSNTLFRFTSYRGHQRIHSDSKSQYYITAPDYIVEELQLVGQNENLTYIQLVEQLKAVDFSGKKSLDGLRNFKNGNIFKLSQLLISLKNNPNFEFVRESEFTKANTRATDNQLKLLWDNLIFSVLIEQSKQKSDGIISLLVANNFIDNFNQQISYSDPETHLEEKQKLIRLVNAKVILPLKIVEEQLNIENPLLSTPQKQIIFDKHKLIITKSINEELVALDKELDSINQSTEIEKEKAEEIEIIRSNALKDNDAVNSILKDTTSNKLKSSLIFEKEKSIQNKIVEIEKINLGNIEARIQNEKSRVILRQLPINPNIVSVNHIKDNISEKIKKNLASTLKKRTAFSKLLVINGIKINIGSKPKNNSYIITAEKHNNGRFKFFLTQYFNNEANRLVEINRCTLDTGESKINMNPVEIDSQFQNYVTFQLNIDPIEFRRDQYGTFWFSYRTNRYLSTDINYTTPRIRLNHPSYGILNTMPDEIEFPETDPLIGITSLGITDFKRIDQEIICYKRGEVSHIENIMASEYKEKTSRLYTSTEISEETETSDEIETVTDTSSTARFEMQSEVSEVISEEKSRELSAGTGVSGEYPGSGVSFNVDASGNFSSTDSFEESSKLSLSKAKEITEKVKDRITTKVSRRRTFKMKKEFEETNKHGFDNRLNSEHVVGIFRWVDKIYKNTLVNYGKRLNYEFMIAEPARNFMQSLIMKQSDPTLNDKSNIQVLDMPKHPSEILGDNADYADISATEIYQAAALYGAKLDKLPDSSVKVSKAYSMIIRDSGSEWKTDDSGAFNDLQIPDGYYCNKIHFKASRITHGDSDDGSTAKVLVGSTWFWVNDDQSLTRNITNIEGTLAVSYRTRDVGSLAINVTAVCTRKASVFNKWRHDSFRSIINAYNNKLKEYNEQQRQIAVQENSFEEVTQREYNYNPAINRNIEKRELKRLCIEMILQNFTSINISNDHYFTHELGEVPTLNLNSTYKDAAKRIDFLEQAFDWDVMAYKFLPYFYSDKERWHDLMHIDGSTDELFKNFLSSGMAKVKLPVRKGFENSVLFFLNTGIPWIGSNLIFDSEDDLGVSINEEIDLGENEIRLEETWTTRVPTTLTIVQKNAASLEFDGLPCNETEQVGGIASGTSELAGIEKGKLIADSSDDE